MNANEVRETDHTLTRQEAAVLLNISLQTLDRRIADGTLGSTKYANRKVRVSRGDVARYARELPDTPATPEVPKAPAAEPKPVRLSLRQLREQG